MMKMKMYCFVFFLSYFFLLTPGNPMAADFYVSPTGTGTVCSEPEPCAFQMALNIAANNTQDDIIYLSSGTYVGIFTYTPAAGENKALTILGEGADVTIVDAENSGWVIHIDTSTVTGDSDAHITIRGMTFQNGNSTSNIEVTGAGLYAVTNSADITVENCEFLNNSLLSNLRGAYGGGVYARSEYGNATLTSNTFTDNSANGAYTAEGGGVYARSEYGNATLTNNTFTGNSVNGNFACGGGVYARSEYGNATLTNNTFTGNSVYADIYYAYGGGVCAEAMYGNVTFTNNTFTGNTVNADYGYGGGTYAFSAQGTVTLSNNTFIGNSFNADTFNGDTYYGYGGGVYASSVGGPVTLSNNTLTGNSVNADIDYAYGGGVFAEARIFGNVNLTNNTFTGNSVNGNFAYGGGICAWISGVGGIVTFTNNTLTNNTSSEFGGAAYVLLDSDIAKAQIYNNIIWDNYAALGGNNGDDLYVESDDGGNGIGAAVELFNNDLGVNANFVSADSEDLVVTDTDNDNYSQNHNIKVDPLLTVDLHLQAGSSCIDAGDDSAPGILSTDFEGDERVDGDNDGIIEVDIGADEFLTEEQKAEQTIEQTIDDVEELVDAGELNHGQGTSLTQKLEAAKKKMDQGNIKAACNIIGAFINHVTDLIATGKVSATEGQALIDAANSIAICN